MTSSTTTTNLHLKEDITTARALSLVAALLLGVLSLAGLLFPDQIYPSEALQQAFLPNDVVNLAIGLPILLGSMGLVGRGKMIGLLLWPGALLYIVYNYTAYIFGSPFGWITLGYIALLLLSAYATLNLLRSVDQESVKGRLAGAVPEKTGGWVLAGFGILFTFRAVGIFIEARLGETPLALTEIGPLVADLVLSAVWIAGGAALLRKRPFGYMSGLGLLFVGSMLFVGLILFLLLQPLLTEAALDLTGILITAIMGLVCFLPFGLFVRGALSRERVA